MLSGKTIPLLFMVVFISCSKEQPDLQVFEDVGNLTSIKGTWKAISFEDYDASSVTYKTSENSWDKEIVITFDDRQDLMEFHGTNTTNRISEGSFSYSTNKSILVSGYVTTYINQPDWGMKFTEIFIANLDLPYKLNKKYLRIYNPEQTKSVTLKKE